VLTPDGKYLIVGTTFDQLPHANPDGSPIIWVEGPDGSPKSIASNAPDPDGLVVFPVGEGIVNLSSFGLSMDMWNLGWAAGSILERCSGGCRGRARDLVPGGESGAHLTPVFFGG
jgi:hypothetical protein